MTKMLETSSLKMKKEEREMKKEIIGTKKWNTSTD